MWYVIQTTTGREQELVEVMQKLLPVEFNSRCFIIKRQFLKRLGGQWKNVVKILFPSYVFLDTKAPEKLFFELKRIPEFTRILGDTAGAFIPLETEEETLLEKLCHGSLDHLVKISWIDFDVSGNIKSINGPLEDFRNAILQMNLRKRYAVIETTISGQKQDIMLGIGLERDR